MERIEAGPSGDAGDRLRVEDDDRVHQWLAKAQEKASDRVATAKEGTRHNTLLNETRALAGYLQYGKGYTENDLIQTMTEAGRRADPDNPSVAQTVLDAIAYGKANPLRLKDELHDLTESGAGRRGNAGANAKNADPNWTIVNPDGDWPPLRLGRLPPAPVFPIDVFPDPVIRVACEVASAVNCDVGVPAGNILAIAGGLNGRATSLELGSNWFASSSFYLANVLPPGGGKSPCQRYLSEAVFAIDADLAAAFVAEKQKYLEEYRANKEAKSPRPVPRRIFVEDTTMKALGRTLAANPRGVLALYDELIVLFGGMNQYKGGKGSDRGTLMKIWAGAMAVIDRVLNEFGEPIRIPHPHLSIAGNLPPDHLTEMLVARKDDGMLDRWLFVYPEKLPRLKVSQRRPVSDDALKNWSEIARRIWDRKLNRKDGRVFPHVVHSTKPGKAAFDRLNDAHTDEVNDTAFPDWLDGPWAKLEAYAGRAALVLALLWHAANPLADQGSLPKVNESIAKHAWRLITYFKANHRRVRAYLQGRGLGVAPDGAKLILNWIENHPDRGRFTQRDLDLSYPPSRNYDPATMEDGLLWLRERNAIRLAPLAKRPPGTPGRKPKPTWLIHPDLLGAQRNQRFQRNGQPEGEAEAESVENVDYVARAEEEAAAEREAILSESEPNEELSP